MRTTIITIVILLFSLSIQAQQAYDTEHPTRIIEQGSSWADSVYSTLSEEERIAQLFWLTVNASGRPAQDHPQIELLKRWQPGGIIFFKNEPQKVVEMINYMQSLSKVPLFTVADGEWGLGMRFSNTLSYPYAMTLGAIQDSYYLQRLGREVARQFREMGLNVNLAPVVDVNNNPANPVIGFRSFGEEPSRVTQNATAFMQGLQSGGVMAVAKHFPGHGDTDKDSHKTLPHIPHSRQHLNQIELKPFAGLINSGVWGVMTAHLEVPALESRKGVPASFSRSIIEGVLRDSLGFKGLVITDAINMKGAKIMGKPGEVDALALAAGNDIVEFTEDLPAAISQVKRMLGKGTLTWPQIADKCKRSLAFKYRMGLTETPQANDSALLHRLNTPEARLLERQLYELSATVLVNRLEAIPVARLDEGHMACLVIGEASEFEKRVNQYLEMPVIRVDEQNDAAVKEALEQLKNYNRLVVAIANGSNSKSTQAEQNRKALMDVILEKRSAVAFLANPYGLVNWKRLEKVDGLVVAYQNNSMSQDVAAQLLFGAVGARGRLPVSVQGLFEVGAGMDTPGGFRLKYTLPEAVGMDSHFIGRNVDSIVHEGIRQKAFPGCQILVACNGSVIFNKAYGYHTWQQRSAVEPGDLYDLASVTKVTGPLPALMKLVEEEVIDLDMPLSHYFDDWRSRLFHPSNKEDLVLRDILAHQAGLIPYISYWPQTMKGGRYSRRWFRLQGEPGYSLEVSDHLFLKDKFPRKKVYRSIRKSQLLPTTDYRYSGLSFMVFPEMICRLTGINYQQLLDSLFYEPLGASTLTYNPLRKFPLQRIVPTEVDHYFRHNLVHGYVHDEAASVLGGVSGNAGLFANANDLAKLFQMYLNGGVYGGRRYLSEAVIEEFTRVQFPDNNNRRALGFDKPLPDNAQLPADKAYPARGVSPQSYGHSGFTGTFVWVDPAVKLVYVFLSNRVFPTRENSRIYDLNIRTSVQQVFYETGRDEDGSAKTED